MARGIDHIVHAVRDLDAAAAVYRNLGFTVGGRNLHPRDWGTQNRIIQTPDTYIELLSIADESGIAPHDPRYFSFGAFNRDFLKRGEGLSMLVLKGQGVPDAEAFRAEDIGGFELYELKREGKKRDGTPLKFSFTLAFARDREAPDVGFFTCQQHHPPEHFWNPEFQKHANGTTGISGIVLVANEPARHCAFLEAFANGNAETSYDGFTIDTLRGAIEMKTPAAFTSRYGIESPNTEHGARLAAIRFSGAKTLAVETAMGAVLVFEPAG